VRACAAGDATECALKSASQEKPERDERA